MERERIAQVLDEVFRDEIAGDPEASFEEFLTDFREMRDPETPVYWIPDTVAAVVDKISGRYFGWHVEALRDEFSYTGEFMFIMVDPKTHKCLTAHTTAGGYCTVGVIFAILTVQDAVDAVQYLLKLANREVRNNA